jgi:regulator of sigma E protease
MSWALLAAIPVFAVLIIIHELGHFLVAKWSDIRVDEFAIGFPPRLFGIKRGETIYSINLLPIGGFVRMPGENGEVTDENGRYDPRNFAAKPAGKRALVLVAGVTMNLLLAWLLFTAADVAGRPDFQPVIGQVVSKSPADQAGLKNGDRILSIDGQSVKYWSDVTSRLRQLGGNVSQDAKTFPVTLVVQHPGTSQPTTITAEALAHPGQNQGRLGIAADESTRLTVKYGWEAPIQGVRDMGDVISATVEGVREVIKGVIPLGQAVTGPVGIVNTTGQVAESVSTIGPYLLLYWTAALSLNLAFVNILPIPALDGGRLLFVGIEVLRRGKRISPEREALVTLVGMAALLFLMLLVTFNDIGNIVGGR